MILEKQMKKQDSPPAWTQEAYRPPGGKHTLFYPRWGGGTYPGGRVPTLVGGTYSGRGGTYPGGGVPTLVGGYLPWLGGTYPRWGVPTLGGGVPTLGRGYLPMVGTPFPPAKVGTPHLDQGRYPPTHR